MGKLSKADRESGSKAAVVEADRLQHRQDVLRRLQSRHVLLATSLQHNLPQLEVALGKVRSGGHQDQAFLHPLVLQGDQTGMVHQKADHTLCAYSVGEKDAESELAEEAL